MFRFQWRRLCYYHVPLISYLGFIFYLSSRTGFELWVDFPHADKALHFILYLPLPILFFRFFQQTNSPFFSQNFFVHGILCSLLYAALDEWHQSFVPGRVMDLRDGFADAISVLVASLAYGLFLVSKNRNISRNLN